MQAAIACKVVFANFHYEHDVEEEGSLAHSFSIFIMSMMFFEGSLVHSFGSFERAISDSTCLLHMLKHYSSGRWWWR